MKYYIGVDIGGTNTVVGITDENAAILCKHSFKTLSPRSPESLCDDIYDTIVKLSEENGIEFRQIEGIGLACPGVIKYNIVVSAGNLQFDNVPLGDIMRKRMNVPIAVCNDANAAALAEYYMGAGKGHKSLVMITIGTGIGGGIILNGEIWAGFGGAGAEIGHVVTVPDGRLCSCGNRGCFETYCSATALVNDTKEAMLNNPDSLLWEICPDITKVDGTTAFKAAKTSDEAAVKLLEGFINFLSMGIANIITLLQPEIVVIGGGMSAEGRTLTDPITAIVNNSGLIKSFHDKTIITTAELKNDAGVIGAAKNIIGELNNG